MMNYRGLSYYMELFMKFVFKILKTIKYIICSVGLFFLTILAAPIIMIFKWDKLWLLSIATEEGCSLAEAKILSVKIPKYKFCRWNLNFPNYHAAGIKINNFPVKKDDDIFEGNKSIDPSYYYMPDNIFYSDHYK
jgi:hypothetical protein